MLKKFYLKLLMSLLLVALAVPQGKATDLIVADGAVTNARIPINGFYYDTGFKNTMVYPSSMLSEMKGASITAISFYTNNENYTALLGGAVTVSLGEIGQTTLTGHLSGLTPVFTGVPVKDGAKCVITFDTPYEYKGGNLAVESYLSSTGSNSPTINFYGIEQSSASFFSYHVNLSVGNTTADFLPKAAFTFEGGTPTPVISGTVTPTTLNFGTVTVGENGTATITVENTGNTAFTPVFSTLEAPFSIETAAEIAAGESKEFTVTYHPTAAGNANGSFNVTIGEQEPITVTLTGTATAPAVDYAVSISDNTGAHNYGNVLVNSSNVWTLTITNNGTKVVTPTLSGIEAPFSTNYTATELAAGESATIAFTFAPTEVNNYSNTVNLSFPEAGDAIAAYTCELSGKAVDESYDPSAENEVVKLVTVDKRSIYEPNFVDTDPNHNNTTPQQLNCYDMRFKMAQHDDPAKRIKARDLRPGNNLFEFYAIDDFGTEFRFATINLKAEGQPSSNPSVSAMDAPIVVTPSVEYYTEDGMPVHSTYTHNKTLNYTEKTYNDINELVDLEGVIDYVNDTWSANTATNAHPDHYKFQIRGVGQFGEKVTELTAEYVKSHIGDYGLIDPEGWYRSMVVAPNNEYDDEGNYVDTYYFYDLYISNEFLQSKGITGPVTVVINTTLSKSGYNADEFKTISVNGVDQIIAREKFKDYSWTVPLVDEMHEGKSMGIVIRSETRPGSDFNKTRSIYIYGGGTGVSNVKVENIYKSSMNVKAYTQKQVDEDTDRGLVAMNAGAQEDVNVLAYGDPAVTGYDLFMNTSASTSGMTKVSTATHETDGSYTVSSQTESSYNDNYAYDRDESLGNIDGMWLNMYKAYANTYYLPVTIANGVGDDGDVHSTGNTYGSAMQQVEDNGSVTFKTSKCYKSTPWVWDGVSYAVYNPEVRLESQLPAATGYELYNYRLWVDYDENAPAWDFEVVNGKINLTNMMDRPLYSGTETSIGGEGEGGKDEWSFVAPADLDKVKLVARYYYKKTSTGKARPTDRDRLYYVVESQEIIPMSGVVTGVDNVSSKAVANVKYYNMMGVESSVPFQGANIEVITFTDGSRTTRKIMK